MVGAVSEIRETVVLQEGSCETLSFHLQWSSDLQIEFVPFYYTIRFESKSQPFWDIASFDEDGLKDKSQLQRFEIKESNTTAASLSVDLIIYNVSLIDKDIYILTVVTYDPGPKDFLYIHSFKDVHVYSPPSKARCFVALSDWVDRLYEIHCHATSGNGNASLACFQDTYGLTSKSDISTDGTDMRGIFWMNSFSPLSCCSYDMQSVLKRESCNHFKWPIENGKYDTIFPNPELKPGNTTFQVSPDDVTAGSCNFKQLLHQTLYIYIVLISLVEHMSVLLV